MEVAAPVRPRVVWGMPARSTRTGMVSSAADRLTLALVRGRRSSSAADLSRWGCCPGRRDDEYLGASSLCLRTRFPMLSESCPTHRVTRGCLLVVRAEKDENGTEEAPEVANLGRPITVRKSALLTSLDFWLQVAIFVFAAGFVDAGFSGDWSRIGVLSKQTEEELQMAALGVVPLAITLIWSISERRKNL